MSSDPPVNLSSLSLYFYLSRLICHGRFISPGPSWRSVWRRLREPAEWRCGVGAQQRIGACPSRRQTERAGEGGAQGQSSSWPAEQRGSGAPRPSRQRSRQSGRRRRRGCAAAKGKKNNKGVSIKDDNSSNFGEALYGSAWT